MPEDFQPDKGTAQRRYEALAPKREGFVQRGYICAEYSIPSLFTRNKSDAELVHPYQSLVARGVNNLASKLMMTLLPPNMSFFKLDADESKMTAEQRDDKTFRDEVEKGLGKVERAFLREIAAWSDRVGLFETMEHLLVTGNGLPYLQPSGGIRLYPLDTYVVERDGDDSPYEIVLKEEVTEHDLPEETLAALKERGNPVGDAAHGVPSDDAKRVYDMYTHIERGPKKWTVYQEVQGIQVHDSDGTYPLDACPWIPLRLFKCAGSAYGRGYVEKYFGDIKSFDGLSEALLDGSTAAAKVVWMIAPNSTTSEEDLADAPNNGFISGKPEDVKPLQLEKFADFRIAFEHANGIKQDLERAFIMNSAIQRSGERVTAEEIRKMVEDLETGLGGVYSLLSLEFQLPYARCRLNQLQKKRRIPELPKGLIKPIITTGITALGRNSDKEKLLELLQTLKETLGPEALQFLNVKAFIMRLCTALGVDIDGILTTDEEDAQKMQEVQAQHSMDTLGPPGIGALGQMLKSDPALMQAMAAGGAPQPTPQA